MKKKKLGTNQLWDDVQDDKTRLSIMYFWQKSLNVFENLDSLPLD